MISYKNEATYNISYNIQSDKYNCTKELTIS